MEKAEKEAFFKYLHGLDEESEGEDSCNASIILRRSRPSRNRAGIPESNAANATRLEPSLARTISAPLPHSLRTETSDIPFKSQSQETLSSANMAKPSENVAAPKASLKQSGKRKRADSIPRVPEAQQIFKGLSIYFFPNNDIAPARKIRIRKALEWGALWVREWRAGITHVVVDNGLSYQDVLKFLNLITLPLDVILVSEIYPADCIIYRFLVKPSQPQYQVTGSEPHSSLQQSPVPTASSEVSLQLKPAKGMPYPAQQTPSQTESSEKPLSSLHLDNAHANANVPATVSRPSNRATDALDDAIEEAKAVQDLPLDFDDGNEISNGSFDLDDLDEEGSEGEREREESKQKLKKGSFNKSWQENFSCMSKHDGAGKSENLNARTIEILQKMSDWYERHHDYWRLIAYRGAIAALRNQGTRITSAQQAFNIPFIGQRLADKIEEIVWTNRLRRLDNTTTEPNDEVFQLFLKIYGVGFAQATKWIDQGHRTIDDLLTKAPLTKNQTIGIERFDDFQTRIPRQEMDRHDQYVRGTCSKIDASVQFTIGGSYRRGAPSSGDVDFIVTKPECSIEVLRTIMLERLIPKLFDKGYLKVGLATTAKDDGSKWHGAAALPGTDVWRRIDFSLVPWDEIGAALIYFTGNDIFNRSIRLLASKKGMRLNQRGLWKDVMRGSRRERIAQGSLVEGKDEKKIFELLGVPWRPPEHRIC